MFSNSLTASPQVMSSTSAIEWPWNVHGQRLGVVALAAARFALDPHVGQEVHLDPLLAVPFARLAAAAGHVEAEPPGRVAAELRLGQLGEQRADQLEHAGVGGRVRLVGELPSGC